MSNWVFGFFHLIRSLNVLSTTISALSGIDLLVSVNLFDLVVVQLSPLPVVVDWSIDSSQNFTFEDFQFFFSQRASFQGK
jgi:hypothetical protein